MLLGSELLRKVVRIVNTQLGHDFLLLGRTRLPVRFGVFKEWWRLGSYWGPFVQLLSKKVGLVCQQDFGPFDLPQIETLSGHFVRGSHHRIDVRTHKFPERLSDIDDFVENIFLLWLKWQMGNITLPILKVFELRT